MSVTLPAEVVEAIDAQRGRTSRSAFVREIVAGVVAAADAGSRAVEAVDDRANGSWTEPSSHKHKRKETLNGGVWRCDCGAMSSDNGRTWR